MNDFLHYHLTTVTFSGENSFRVEGFLPTHDGALDPCFCEFVLH